MARKATVASDLKMVKQIDEADVDLPFGESDFVENYLLRLTREGKPLRARERARTKALLAFVRQKQRLAFGSDEDS